MLACLDSLDSHTARTNRLVDARRRITSSDRSGPTSCTRTTSATRISRPCGVRQPCVKGSISSIRVSNVCSPRYTGTTIETVCSRMRPSSTEVTDRRIAERLTLSRYQVAPERPLQALREPATSPRHSTLVLASWDDRPPHRSNLRPNYPRAHHHRYFSLCLPTIFLPFRKGSHAQTLLSGLTRAAVRLTGSCTSRLDPGPSAELPR